VRPATTFVILALLVVIAIAGAVVAVQLLSR
jgi:hypothetical protein